ncbi:hypothetical protein DOTSEDRAFT_77249 [Dothistroma septosporum NZE10]|uniref:Uncharacterized protein n=1 Tax=Dothistroma septosporum (strain NZE10 / CBS 128990) TaxID=675120 RepID=N1Q326_DOTSN|nr:hypothetical protein DOTSEDRAFT_77249 [Dothistroma septosporum NZE10]
MPTTRSQKQAIMSASSNQHTIPPKLRTGAGRVNKPGKPTRKQHVIYDPWQNARRQRQAPKLRVMFVRFLLQRLEAQGIAAEGLPRDELREHIAAMSDNFLALAASLERDERNVDDLADVFGQIVVPSDSDVVDMMDLLSSTSLLGGGAMSTERVVDAEECLAASETAVDSDGSTARHLLPDNDEPGEDDYDYRVE